MPPYSSIAPPIMTAPGFEPFLFPSVGEQLVGMIYLAGGEGPRPICILCHGFPGAEKNFDIAYALRDQGWHAVIWSPRGCWGSSGSYTLSGIVPDLAALIEHLQAGPWLIDWERLALLGYSLGAAHVVQFCHQQPHLVRALALVAPVGDFRECSLSAEAATDAANFLTGTTPIGLQREWMGQAWEQNPIDLITTCARPLLVVLGGADTTVPPHVPQALFDACPGQSKLVEYSTADHLFSAHRPELVRTVIHWLGSQLGNT